MRVVHLIEVEILPECRTLGQLARERLLAGFADMSEQANRVQAEALARITSKSPLDPDFPFIAGLDALTAGGEHYVALWNLRQATLNLLAAHIFHLFDQHHAKYKRQLRAWKRRPVDWSALLSASVVQELGLVANAAKHGMDKRTDDLKRRRPGLFVNPLDAILGESRIDPTGSGPFAGDGLFVTVADLVKYQNAVESLWTEMAAAHRAMLRPGGQKP